MARKRQVEKTRAGRMESCMWPPITHVAVSAASLLYCPNETSWKQFPGFGSLERIKSPNIQREDRFESPLGLSALEGISSDRGQVGGSDWNHSAQYRINRRCAALHAYESTNPRTSAAKKPSFSPHLLKFTQPGDTCLTDTRYPIPALRITYPHPPERSFSATLGSHVGRSRSG